MWVSELWHIFSMMAWGLCSLDMSINIFLVPFAVPSYGAFNVCKSSHDTCCCFLALGTQLINSDGAGTPHLLSLALTLLLSHTHTHLHTHGHEPGCAFFSAHTVSRPAHAYWCLSTLAHNARHVKIPRYFSCGSEPKSALIMVARSALLRTVRWQASWQPHMWLCLCLFIRTPPGATCLHPSCPLLSTQEGTGCPHNRPVPFPKINLIHNTLSWPQVVTGRYRQYLCS